MIPKSTKLGPTGAHSGSNLLTGPFAPSNFQGVMLKKPVEGTCPTTPRDPLWSGPTELAPFACKNTRGSAKRAAAHSSETLNSKHTCSTHRYDLASGALGSARSWLGRPRMLCSLLEAGTLLDAMAFFAGTALSMASSRRSEAW